MKKFQTKMAVKLGREILLKRIKSLFHFCPENGIIPSEWNSAITTLLHKKGDIRELGKCRLISVLCPYKLFTKTIAISMEGKGNFYQSIEQEALGRITRPSTSN